MVMAEKKKFNLSMPVWLAERFEEAFLKMGRGEKQRWLACAGAVFAWLKLSDKEREELGSRFLVADGQDQKTEALQAEIAGKAAQPIRLVGRSFPSTAGNSNESTKRSK